MTKYQEKSQTVISRQNSTLIFFFFLTKKLHIFVAFEDYNFFHH